MKRVIIVLIFFVAIVVSGIILPAIFGFGGSLLPLIFIVALPLYFGLGVAVILLASALSLLLEFIGGYGPGSFSLSLLVIMLILVISERFFNLEPIRASNRRPLFYLPCISFLGLMLFCVFSVFFGLFSEPVAGDGILRVIRDQRYLGWQTALYIFTGILVFFLLFKSLDRKKDGYFSSGFR